MLWGTAKEIITPIQPMLQACIGAYTDKYLTVFDDIYVRALILERDGFKVGFMTFDILFHDRSLNDALEAYAQSTHHIAPGSLVITYTHAHTAPATKGYNIGAYDADYEAFLLERAKICLDRAVYAMTPGTLEWGSFDANYNISRRGKVNGKHSPDDLIPDPDYPCDKEFSVLCVRDEAGRVRSVLMNYACHPVFYPTPRMLSGEFPARLCHYIDAAYYGCVSLYCQSACGDVRPLPTVIQNENNEYEFHAQNFGVIDSFAKDICRDVVGFIDQSGCEKPEFTQPWASCAFTAELPLEPAPPEYFEEKAAFYKDAEIGIMKDNIDYIMQIGYDALPETLPLHCQIIRLSPEYYIATTGGEPCYGVKKAITAAFPGCKVLFIGYTDDCAYLVDDVLLEEGGYEPCSYLEYRMKGPLKTGVTKLYTQYFTEAKAKL